MRLLRFTQETVDDDRYRVEVSLEGAGPRRIAKADITFRLTEQDEEDLRWYLEDYLQWPHEPAPAIAARVEQRIEQLGTGLFASIFEYNATTRKLWYAASEKLPETRIEVVTTVEQATSIPWELLREPDAEVPLALLAHSFVRAQPEARRPARALAAEAGPGTHPARHLPPGSRRGRALPLSRDPDSQGARRNFAQSLRSPRPAPADL